MKITVFALAISAISVSTLAYGEDSQRYTITQTAEGYVRTDNATGAMSLCKQKGDQLVCRMAADERKAYDADIATLETTIDSLEKRIAALENGAPGGKPQTKPMETDSEFQTSLNRMDQFFRRFMGIVKEFQQFGGEAAPAPDKT